MMVIIPFSVGGVKGLFDFICHRGPLGSVDDAFRAVKLDEPKESMQIQALIHSVQGVDGVDHAVEVSGVFHVRIIPYSGLDVKGNLTDFFVHHATDHAALKGLALPRVDAPLVAARALDATVAVQRALEFLLGLLHGCIITYLWGNARVHPKKLSDVNLCGIRT